jgi:hypothetical protein
MKCVFAAMLAIALFSRSLSFAQPGTTNVPVKVYPAEEAYLLVGDTQTISGKVAQVTMKQKVTYLNLQKPYPDMPFTGVIFAARTNLFGDLEQLKDKTVLITGKVATYANTPQIVIDSQAQLEVVGEELATSRGDEGIRKNPEVQPGLMAHRVRSLEEPANVIANTSAPAQVGGLGSSMAVWSIVGSLVVITGLLTCLVIMLRRSGVGAKRMPVSVVSLPWDNLPLTEGSDSLAKSTDTPSSVQTAAVRQQVVAELTEYAKQSLVQGLYSQRKGLLETQEEAQRQLAALEERLAAMDPPLQERIQAYEARIAELEKELDMRGEAVRDLVQAAVLLIRERLEKAKEEVRTEFN